MQEDRIEKIVEYFRVNKGVYTYHAIVDQLTKQGYEENEILEAWSRVSSNNAISDFIPKVPMDKVLTMPGFWFALFGFLLGAPIGTALAAAIGAAMSIGSYGILGLVLGGLFVLVILIWAITAIVKNWRDNQAIAKGLLTGLILTVVLPFIPYFIVAGICSAIFRGY